METCCEHCEKLFRIKPSARKRNRGKFCSRECCTQFKQQSNTICATCGLYFRVKSSRRIRSKSGLFFCSRICKDLAQRIGGIEAIQPNHYGTGYLAKAWNHNLHCCNRCGYDSIPEILEVHHKDHNHNNNEVDNLELLCPNCHAIEHRIGDKIQGESLAFARPSRSVRF